MLLELLNLQLTRFRRYFKHKTAPKLITVALFALVFLAVAVGLYALFGRGLSFLNNYPYFKSVVSLYALELFFLLVSFLLLISSLISLLFALFRGKSQFLLAASPNYSLLPKFSVYTTAISSLWIFLVVMLPVLLAAGKAFNLNFVDLLPALAASLLLPKLIILISYCAILLCGYALYSLSPRLASFKNLVIGCAVLVVASFIALASGFARRDFVALFNAENLQLTSAPTAPVAQAFHHYPSTLAAQSLSLLEQHQPLLAWAKTLELFILVLIFWALANVLTKNFLNLWQKLSETVAQAELKPKPSGLINLGLIKNGTGAIVYKEAGTLWRSGRSAFWLLFMLILWLCYIGINFKLQTNLNRYAYSRPELPLTVIAMQLLILIYFLASLTLRFAFPSFSAEKNTAWIFASSPLPVEKILTAKFYFFAATFGLIALLVQLLNSFGLGLGPVNSLIFVVFGLLAAAFVVALGLFLGARYPNFETDDPETLSTSGPGLGFVFSAVVFGFLCAWSFLKFLSGTPWFAAMLMLFCLCGTVLLLNAAKHAARDTEFVANLD